MGIRQLLLAFLIGLGLAANANAKDLKELNQDEIWSLQQRLRDARCFEAALDGRLSPAFEAALKNCPDQDPVLRIEAAMHTAAIRATAVDGQCKIAATASWDKTVRVWSIPDGRLIRIQRLPVDRGDEGKVYAVAISPDGKWIAAGGWDAYRKTGKQEHSLYLFDAEGGKVVRRIGGWANVISHLAYSSDGKRIAVSLGGSQGLRVVEMDSGRELMADKAYEGSSYGGAFGPDGALYTTSYDGNIRRYNSALKLTHKVKAQGGQQPFSIAVDPTGKRLAVGFSNALAVDILDAANLNRVAAADTKEMKWGGLSEVNWSHDGKLLGAGTHSVLRNGWWPNVMRTWDREGRKIVAEDIALAGDTIASLVPCKDFTVFASAEPTYGVLYPDGKVSVLGNNPVVDMREKRGNDYTVSADGTRIRFGLDMGGKDPVLLDLLAGTVNRSPDAPLDLKPSDITGLKVEKWLNEYTPTLDGKPIKLDSYERARSLAIRPDRTGLILGTEYWLRSLAADGTQRWGHAMPGVAWGVNLARDGELVIVVNSDGTIRWHRWSDGQELLALFVQKEDLRWIAWTPTGYYQASQGAENLIGWHLNRGWDQPPDYFPAARFRERFNRPDIVRLVLETLDEGEAIKRANEGTRRRVETKPLLAALPPVVRITSPVTGTRFTEAEATIGFELRLPSGGKVDRLEVFLDGRLQEERKSLSSLQGELKVKVPNRDVELSLIAWSGELASEPAVIKLAWAGATDIFKPKLYALVVGVSKYVDKGYELRFAAKDAGDFAQMLEAQGGGLYGEVKVKLLRDGEVTRDTIVDGLEWLETEVTSRDVGIVFLAGHGWTDEKGAYWFLPSNANLDRVRRTAIAQDDIRRTLRNLAGKAVLFLDTCHSGQAMQETSLRRGAVDIDAVINDFVAAENGVVVFASSKGKEVSLENEAWQNGAFTKAVVEGLHLGKANLLNTGKITASMLDVFVAERVKQLTNGKQHPVMTKPDTVPDFPLAIVRR